MKKETVNPIIAYQGIEGSNSHSACLQWYPSHQTLSYINFEDAIRSVEEQTAELAMIPIENSQGGRVAEVHRLLFELNLNIIAEHYLPVCYVLCASSNASVDSLDTVISHPQALAQCHENIKALGLKMEPHADTAGAALHIKHTDDPKFAAIATVEAAKLYDLQVLRNRFEDNLYNVTRFIVFSRDNAPAKSESATITSLVFEVRSIPAVLYKCLGGFATNAVNLIKLESHIPIGTNETASFYVEVEGHQDSLPVRRALEELNLFSRSVRLLGSYPAARNRKTNRGRLA